MDWFWDMQAGIIESKRRAKRRGEGEEQERAGFDSCWRGKEGKEKGTSQLMRGGGLVRSAKKAKVRGYQIEIKGIAQQRNGRKRK